MHLEEQETFHNSFVPKGLFHDLMDTGNNEFFDKIQGHTIEQIYNRFNDVTWTIQQFRNRWEAEYPSVDNNPLFAEYGIN